ncbi:C40 family peptidase [Streptomyces sp. CHA1]|uniref:C40 family peptidase n=1 Tax=Streptomyces TaxID=1883 RepID=UPI001BFBFE30|nr:MULTISPECIES: C40 family peptidase [unclassified Streptomyces]MBT3160125.1 C40 family peptidase [Streptomyces sp. G11C]MCO6704323.1 C40 family peptidase [Streptomyces sp. CHB9.2]MCO6710593.1 C40 family peptidase [Streptomyces sp. CHA3]MCO6716393.1 C40 family peptidase [Streptomyces sp. CHB19.2]MCO6722524.1 C40 family peptidase [Streptomyces sp. Vc714c-19]
MKKTTVAVLGLCATVPLLLAVPVLAIATGTASASCSPGEAQDVDTAAVAAQVKAVLAGGEKGSVAVPGLGDPADQVPNAKTIQATGVAMNVPARGQVVALATALQESGLRNLTYGDRDSLGLFQQRPSMGWGTAKKILDPVHASTKFYEGLRKVSGWQSLSVTQAAQAVQKSGFPDAYAKWEPLATALQRTIEPLLHKADAASPNSSPSSSADAGSPSPDSEDGCSADSNGAGFGTIPAGALPDEYKIPATAPREVQTAIRWALGQLGTPYQWGGNCTDSHGKDPMGRCDCSSLMQQAYKAAGVSLTRTTYTQVKDGEAVSVGALEPGDLLFTEGTASVPEHVGMFIGQGLVVHAPHTGDVVRIATLASWKPRLLAARRVV